MVSKNESIPFPWGYIEGLNTVQPSTDPGNDSKTICETVAGIDLSISKDLKLGNDYSDKTINLKKINIHLTQMPQKNKPR